MAAYNFQRQFAAAIRAGTKTSTIRRRRANGYVPAAGERIRLYTGMRTVQCELLRVVEVVRVRPVVIDTTNLTFSLLLDGAWLRPADLGLLAAQEGFASVAAMRTFFREQYGSEQFSMYLIEWCPQADRQESDA